MNMTYRKLVVSGRMAEFYDYEMPVAYGYSRSEGGSKGRGVVKELSEGQVLEEDLSPVWRAKRMVRRIVEANARQWYRQDGSAFIPLFFTLTFAENENDEAEANRKFTLGMERFNYAWRQIIQGGLKYVAVPERQDRGALHYHIILFNVPFIPMLKEQLLQIWGVGFTNYRKVSNNKVARYLTKYMGKDMGADRNLNGKRYFTSRGLLKPREVMDDDLVAQIEASVPFKFLDWTSKPIPHKRFGTIVYRRYLLPEGFDMKALLDSADAFVTAPGSVTLAVAHDRTTDPAASGRPLNLDN